MDSKELSDNYEDYLIEFMTPVQPSEYQEPPKTTKGKSKPLIDRQLKIIGDVKDLIHTDAVKRIPRWKSPIKGGNGETLNKGEPHCTRVKTSKRTFQQLRGGIQIGMLGVAYAEGKKVSKKKYLEWLDKWDDSHLFRIYDYKRAGMTAKEIAIALGYAPNDFHYLTRRSKPIRVALHYGKQEAKKIKQSGLTAYEYVYDHLHPEIKKEWQDLILAHKNKDYDEQNRLWDNMNAKGNKHKQILFIQAYISTRFDFSKSMAIVGIKKVELDKWLKSDTFQTLWEEVLAHRNAYFENKLFDMVDMGDTKATLFVNERLNRMVYGKELKLTGDTNQPLQYQLKANELDLTMLSIELQEMIYAELQAKGLMPNNVINVESTPLLENHNDKNQL
jgi:hypothetical protein